MENKHLLIFDMDGLLVNTEAVYRDGWRYAINQQKLKVPTEVIESWVGKGMAETKGYLKTLTTQDSIEKLVAAREKYIYQELEQGKITLKPYALEVLQKAKLEGVKIALATSTAKKRAVDILQRLGIYEYFDFTSFGDQVSAVKPAPDVYLNALTLANSSSSDAIAIEDSATGCEAASLAGIDVILIPDDSFHKIGEQDLTAVNTLKFEAETLSSVIELLNGV